MDSEELIAQVEGFIEIYGEPDSSDAEFSEPDAEFLRFVLAERAGELPEELVTALRKVASERSVTL